ncbi:winged helix-turn-helix domain-containing protein [Acetobacter oryzifermentans]|uniref:winged helix-turn-helix domain-containing protein n=1 Tax=Acetobacter oryzifermentans TaxID=1633874 RepID=UPI0039BFED87
MPRSAASSPATPAATPASTRRRWSKFWWQDHERDPALRLCSLAAQGLWMRLLCLMHEAEPYGHLCVNGKPLHPRQIAQMVGVSPQQVRRYMAELQDAGVYATTAEGVPYSRRLVRDRAASDAGAAWGRTGGNPQLKAEPPLSGAEQGITPAPRAAVMLQEAEAETEAEAEHPLTKFGPDTDARTHLFKSGLDFLKKATGRPDRSARAILGRWLKLAGDDAAVVLNVLAECATFNPAEPVAWIDATLRTQLQMRPAPEPTSPHARRMAAWDGVPDMEGV